MSNLYKILNNIRTGYMSSLSLFCAILFSGFFCALTTFGQTNPTAQSLPYSQNFTGLVAPTYPAGWGGWSITAAPTTAFMTAAPSADLALVTATNATTSNHVGEISNKLSMRITGTASSFPVLAINTTGISTTISMVYIAGTQANTLSGRVGEIGLQYRVGTTGTFTNITGSTYQNLANASVTSGTAGANFTNVSFSLPAACQNQSVVQLRWAYREVSGAGSRPQFSIDNVSITTTTNPGVVTTTPSQLYGFTATTPSPSTSQPITVSGSGLSSNLTLNAPTGYEVRTGTNPFASSLSLTPSSGSISPTVVDVRLTGSTVGTFNSQLTFSTTSAMLPSVDLYGTVTAGPPTIVTTGTLSAFSTAQGTPSTEQSFTVSATNLTANMTITPPAGYQVSQTSGSGFANSITLTPSSGTVNTTTIFVRMTGATAGSFSGNISVASTGATTQTVAVSGNVLAVPSVATNSATLRKLYTNTGIASDTLCFRVSGSNLTNNVDITLTGSDFELSTSPTGPFGPGPLNLPQTLGSLAETQIFVRIKSTATGSPTGTIAISSTGATTLNRNLSGQVYGAGVPFGVGNIVLFRAGENGGIGGVANACPSFIDEITPGGVSVQTIALPLVPNGLGTNNARFTSSGTSLSEGYLNLSPDGRYLTFTGYDVPVNTAGVASTTVSGANNNRIVARVTYDGTINTETRINDGYLNSNIRSAVTIDGNSYWTGGTGTNGGTRYVTHGSTGASVQISGSPTNTRVVNISNSQLYTSSASGSNVGINKVGTGLQTTGGNSTTLISSITGNDPYNFIFFDRDASISGNDLLYVANGAFQTAPNSSLRKFSFDGTNWTLRGTIVGDFRAVTGRVVGSTIQLFVTVGSGNPNTLYRIDDNSSYNANISNNGASLVANPTAPVIAALPSGITFISTSPTGSIYKGVAFAPVNNPTPTVAHIYQSPATTTAPQGTTATEIARIEITSTIGSALLTGLTLTSGGTYTTSDITNFKLISSTDGVLDESDVLLSSTPVVSSGSSILFPSIAYSIPVDQVRYVFVCADISGCATVGRTVNVSLNLTNINYADANKIGSSTFTSSNKSFVLGTPSNVTDVTAPSGFPKVTLTWTNPDCFTDVVIVASTSPIVGTPSGTPTFNTVYTSAPSLLNGKCVYRGSSFPINITGLTLGTQYYFKLFTNNGGVYSSGVEVTATPNIVNYYAVTSGTIDGAIWSLTPTGSPVLPSVLGGFGSAVNLIIRPGVTAQIVNSNVPCNDITVMSGGKLWRNSDASTNMAYFNIVGDIICNGEIGNGSTFDAIGFNFEGTNQTISGTGLCNIGRIRKFSNTNQVTNLTISNHTSLLFPGLGSFYNSADNTRFNLTIDQNGILEIVDPTSSISIDGFDGTSVGQRGGNIIVNGQLISQGGVFSKNNNTSDLNPTFGTNFTVGSTGNLNLQNLECDVLGGKGSTFTINTGGKVSIYNALTITSGQLTQNGSLILKSTLSSTARIAQSNGSINGTVTSERYVQNGGWHFTGTQLGGQTVVDWNDDMQTLGPMPGVEVPNPGYYTSFIYEYDQSDNSPIPYSSNLTNGWKVPTTSNLDTYKGYRCYLQSGTLLDNTGTYNMNPPAFNLSYVPTSVYPGWNLIMNPHLSAVNLSGFSFGANVQQVIVIWNPLTQSYQYAGTLGGLTGVTLNNSISPIASGQAFFVKCTAPSTLTIPQTAKSANSGSFFRTAVQTPNALEIRLKTPSSEFDATLLQFVDGSQQGYETSLDASKLMNLNFNVYTIVDGQKFAINAMPLVDETVIVPLGYSTKQSGIHGFQFDGLNLINGYSKVYLKDMLSNTIVEITSSDTYTFQTESGEFDQRFEVIFTNSVTQVSSLKNDDSFVLYPNPVIGDQFMISTPNNTSDVNVTVCDVLGRVITNGFFKKGDLIKVSKPSIKGQYFVKITTQNKTITKVIESK